MKWKLDTRKEFIFAIECWVNEKNASLTELEAECMHACEDLLLSRLCCVDKNNHIFN